MYVFIYCRSKSWCLNIGDSILSSKSALQLYKSQILCADHFDDSQFMNRTSRNRLIHNAIPTLFEYDYKIPRCQQSKPFEPAFVFKEIPSNCEIPRCQQSEPLEPGFVFTEIPSNYEMPRRQQSEPLKPAFVFKEIPSNYEIPRCQQSEPLEPAFVFTEIPSDSIPIWDEKILQGADQMSSPDIELSKKDSREELSFFLLIPWSIA